MSDNESIFDMNSQYDDCQKLPQRIEILDKQFETYQTYCDYLTNNALTVRREINNNERIVIDLYNEEGSEDESSFYSDSDSDSGSSCETDDESD